MPGIQEAARKARKRRMKVVFFKVINSLSWRNGFYILFSAHGTDTGIRKGPTIPRPFPD